MRQYAAVGLIEYDIGDGSLDFWIFERIIISEELWV